MTLPLTLRQVIMVKDWSVFHRVTESPKAMATTLPSADWAAQVGFLFK